MAHDRLMELASSDAGLTDILGQLRGAGLREVVGPDPLLRAQVADTVLDEFLSVAVRDLSDRVIFGLALSLPACIIQRGVGQEALQYCLDHGNLTPAEVTSVWDRMARPGGPSESLRAAHRRIATVVLHAGRVELSYWYYQFLRDNIGQLVRECPEELADVMLNPKFSAAFAGEALAAITRSGIQLDDLESGPLRYPVGAMRYLAADRTGGHSTQLVTG
jgi:hypothetical protein